MTLSSYLLFIPACVALNLVPGPNNILSMNNASRFGFRPAVMAGVGRLVAFATMIVLTALGLAMVLAGSSRFFVVLKIVGGLYLIWIAMSLWRSPVTHLAFDGQHSNVSTMRLTMQEFMCAASNPKAILIFTAIFPQFLNTTEPLLAQFLLMGATFLVFEWGTIALYAFAGVHVRRFLNNAAGQRYFNRFSAVLLGIIGLIVLMSNPSHG
ncbi:LysE family translocator [Hydromonas duriensis]|uniref:Threonine/homoserine/homoserine lactone efflux protein n=1 Tax=Hydromonas duriensis TaxID=1527608 RepID=A0A4R6Y9Z7_9BURK|nr:LysE family translocator [Hydromonas duriensis]TDR32353.1 threonine/homoserine/homoserine lactone efflux protein [Hydromonas duriensis]